MERKQSQSMNQREIAISLAFCLYLLNVDVANDAQRVILLSWTNKSTSGTSFDAKPNGEEDVAAVAFPDFRLCQDLKKREHLIENLNSCPGKRDRRYNSVATK